MDRPWHRFYPAHLAPSASYPDIPVWGLLARVPPNRVALIDADRPMTYGELCARVDGVAGWMRDQGVGPGERVLLQLPNSVAFVVAYYGALRAGGIVSAASPETGADALAFQVADVDPVLTITADTHLGAGATPPKHVVDIAVLQYTSGTTGRSKGAVMSHGNLVANALQNARWFGWGADEVTLGVLPFCHTWGMCICLNSTFAVGGTLVLAERFDPEATFRLIARHRATVLYGSATMFHRLLDLRKRDVYSLRHVKAGAMLTQGDLKARWDERYPHAPLQQGYGLTEASPESHNNPPAAFRAGTVGVPLQDTDCCLIEGEVCLKGPQVTGGYWRNPDETAGAFVDGWLRTGDVGEMDADGYLTIVDRKKDLLKYRGYSISPNAIEECLLRLPGVREAVVVGRADPREGDIPVAFLVVDPPLADEQILAACRASLARYEVPREIRRVESIPRNLLGKPLRRSLREMLAL